MSDDQIAVRDGVRAFCEGRLASDRLSDFEGELDREFWRELAELGAFALRRSELEGGLGLGMAEAVLVFAELGRRLAPGPTIWTHLSAGLIEGAAEGEVVVGGVEAIRAAKGPHLVASLESLDVLLVLSEDGVAKILAAELEAEPTAQAFDPLNPVSVVEGLPAGEVVGDAELAHRMWLEGVVLSAAQMLGMSEATLDLANHYAKTREQFDRPIGSFQAIKHMLADMYCRQEVARASAYAAGVTIDTPSVGDVAHAARAAKLTCGKAAMKNARACIQIHGGMGYTWEVPAHYYLKRSWMLENSFGTTEEHADELGSLIADSLDRPTVV
ncbi:MAG: acyl-CoA/acyl-ACP dehydrogenase [Deltaproteobacteria bacterium]|nr:acyl-CoA/acyl-ACP dehydrogenase [Deltaproteobacteria bacterium]